MDKKGVMTRASSQTALATAATQHTVTEPLDSPTEHTMIPAPHVQPPTVTATAHVQPPTVTATAHVQLLTVTATAHV